MSIDDTTRGRPSAARFDTATKREEPLPIAIDAEADAALSVARAAAGSHELRCDVCDEPIEGEPAGRGLYMWTRGDEVRFEEPGLCPNCATAIGVTALAAWDAE